MSKRWQLGVYGGGLALAALGCSDGDGGGGGAQSDEFATYWADSEAWCRYMVDCEIQERDECEQFWPTVEETQGALADADVEASDLADCEKAARALDDCVLSLSCDAYAAGGCDANQDNFGIACSEVNAALETYLNEHRDPPFAGPFTGEFYGNESGTFTGVLARDGSLSLELTSPSLGELEGEGTVNYSGSAAFHAGDDVSDLMDFSGVLSGSSTTFDGNGSWDSEDGGNGFWTLTSE